MQLSVLPLLDAGAVEAQDALLGDLEHVGAPDVLHVCTF